MKRVLRAAGMLFWISVAAIALGRQSSTVIVTVQVPGSLESFKDRQLEVILYEFDSRVADRAATQIEKYLQPIRHDQGKDTTRVVSLGAKATINPRLRYYVTAFVVDDAAKRTHIAEKDGKSGICNVLTDGNPDRVVLIARPVR